MSEMHVLHSGPTMKSTASLGANRIAKFCALCPAHTRHSQTEQKKRERETEIAAPKLSISH